MRIPKRIAITLLVLGVTGTIVGCEGSRTVAPRETRTTQASLFSSSLVECPSNEAASTTATISPLGGTLTLNGTVVTIPAGALLAPVTMTLTMPASQYLELDVTVDGASHFLFELPVIVTVSYARCTRANIFRAPLSAWYIDSDTKEMLERMPSLDNKLLRTVTFTTGHFSGYALAN